jgi:predicted SnoaL-like aldol condensation-catalyzing enzyme
MSTEENKMLVRRQFDEIWNGGNWATADELYAPDYVNHDPYNPDQGTGPDGFKQRVGGYRSVLHGFDLRIERQIAEGDWVETHWSLRGTRRGTGGYRSDRQVGLCGRAAPEPHCRWQVRRRMGSLEYPRAASPDWGCAASSSVIGHGCGREFLGV